MQIAQDTFSQGQVNPIVPCRSADLNKLCIDLHNVMQMFRNIELNGDNRLQRYRDLDPVIATKVKKGLDFPAFDYVLI